MPLGMPIVDFAPANMLQLLLVTVLAALCGGGIATGLIMRFWAPTLKRMAASLEREQRRRRAGAADAHGPREESHHDDQGAKDQAGDLAVRDLAALTDDLDQQALALRALARRITSESTPGSLPAAVLDAAAERADDIARAAAHAHRTYKRVSHLLDGHGAEPHAESEALLPRYRAMRPDEPKRVSREREEVALHRDADEPRRRTAHEDRMPQHRPEQEALAPRARRGGEVPAPRLRDLAPGPRAGPPDRPPAPRRPADLAGPRRRGSDERW